LSEIPTPADKARAKMTPKPVVSAFRRAFLADTRDAKVLLAWFAEACHAAETVARGTPEETYRAIGRREVWLMMQDVLRITDQDIRDVQEYVSRMGD
jgi:hypothetical protein